jgi:hypothetical protein
MRMIKSCIKIVDALYYVLIEENISKNLSYDDIQSFIKQVLPHIGFQKLLVEELYNQKRYHEAYKTLDVGSLCRQFYLSDFYLAHSHITKYVQMITFSILSLEVRGYKLLLLA